MADVKQANGQAQTPVQTSDPNAALAALLAANPGLAALVAQAQPQAAQVIAPAVLSHVPTVAPVPCAGVGTEKPTAIVYRTTVTVKGTQVVLVYDMGDPAIFHQAERTEVIDPATGKAKKVKTGKILERRNDKGKLTPYVQWSFVPDGGDPNKPTLFGMCVPDFRLLVKR